MTLYVCLSSARHHMRNDLWLRGFDTILVSKLVDALIPISVKFSLLAKFPLDFSAERVELNSFSYRLRVIKASIRRFRRAMQSAIQEKVPVPPGRNGEAQDSQSDPDERAYMAALKQITSGKVREAKALVQLMIARQPQDARALHLLGLVHYELGELEEAAARLRESVAAAPSAVDALCDLAAVLRDLKQFEDALQICMTAISLDAKYYPAYANLGRIYKALGRLEESAACYLQAVEIAPDYARGYCDLGLAYLALGRTDEAVETCRKATGLSPDDADAVLALGKTLTSAGKLHDAIALYEEADVKHKGQLPILCALAGAYADSRQLQKALVTHRRSLEIAPDVPDAHIALGDTFRKTGRAAEALKCYKYAVSIARDNAVAIARVAETLAGLGQIEAAIENGQKAIAIDASLPAPYRTISRSLIKLGRFAEAFSIQARAVTLDKSDPESLSDYFRLARQICDWQGISETESSLRNACRQSSMKIPPSPLLDLECSAEDILLAARSWAKQYRCEKPLEVPASKPRTPAGQPIHLAYVYEDCGDEKLVEFLRTVIAGHDRERFRISGFFLGGPEDGEGRSGLAKSFDTSEDIGHLPYCAAARKIHDARVDVLVTFEGYNSKAVPAILAHRPAPIQVSYLGYPATTGADFVDYIISDAYLTTLDQQPFFDEKIVQLPDCFMAVPLPDNRPGSSASPNRQSLGLPEKGIVFCCFNPARTISSECFGVWMNILKNVPGSILWLLDDNEAATKNLKRNAAALGLDPARLIFSPHCARQDHLARLALADLYLDTMPSGSIGAVAESLAAGVPVLSNAGETMASRMSGSLLKTCGLGDMITHAHEHYDHAARLMTCDPRSLKQLRARLAANMKTVRPFDTARYQCGLDAAFEHMVTIARNEELPYAFAVAIGDEDKTDSQAGKDARPADEESILPELANAC